jgi:cell division protein FtsB
MGAKISNKPIFWKLAIGFLVLGFLLYVFLIGKGGFYQVWHKKKELKEWEELVAKMRTENDSLKQVLSRLESDLEYVEKVAREEYGMIKKGERLYRLRELASEKKKN